jgi:hypothetical protein
MESSNLPVVIPPVVSEAKLELEIVRALPAIKSGADYAVCAEALKTIKHNLKMVEELEEAEKRPLLDDLKKIRDKYTPSRTHYSLAEAHLKKQISEYTIAQERLRREEQHKAEAEAERERSNLRRRATKASAKGALDKAAQLFEQAEGVVAPVLDIAPPKVEGVHTVEKWDFEILNEKKIPAVYKIVDIKKIADVVSTMKEAAQEIIGPGIRVFKTLTVASKSKQPEV